VSVGGYVKLDIIYSDKVVTTIPAIGPTNVPLDTDKEKDNSQTNLDVRQSRLRVTWDETVGGVKISGRIEGDFTTTDGNALTSNSRHLRLRHAFARADHPSGFFLLAGQWFSLFMNDEIAAAAAVRTVDFNGPAGQIFARQPQLRVGWKVPMGPTGTLTLEGDIEKHSVEDLGSPVVNESQGEGQVTPLFGGKVSWRHPIFQAEAALMLGDNTVILPGGRDESDAAWAFQVSAEARLRPVTLFGSYYTQQGLGRLVNGDFASADSHPGGQFGNVESQGFYVGAGLALTPETTVNAIYGWAKSDEDASIGWTGSHLEKQQSIHVNVFHRFWKNWQVGLEYQRRDVETFSGVEGDVTIVRGALWYFF